MARAQRLDLLWEHQFTARIRRMFVGRLIALPIAGTVLLGLCLVDGDRARLAVVAGVFALEIAVAVYYLARARRVPPTPRDVAVNVILLAAGGVTFVYATGDVTSPLLPLLTVPAMLTGGAFGRGAIRLLILTPVSVTIVFAIAILSGLMPRFTPLFDNQPGAWLAVYLTAIALATAAVWRGTGLLLDDAHDLAESLEAANSDLAQDMEARQQANAVFVGQLAHELRNPLAAVKGLTDLVRADPANPANPEHLAVVAEEIRRLEATLDATLTFGKPTPPQRERYFELRDTYASALRILAARLERRGVQVETSWPEPLPFRGDEQGFRQVFFNLLANAADAMPGGGKISVRAAREAAGYVVHFADTGPGLPKELEGRLFEPYTSGKPDGNGLGLSIARQIVTGHAGALTAANRPGGGAEFTLTLPLEEPDARPGR